MKRLLPLFLCAVLLTACGSDTPKITPQDAYNMLSRGFTANVNISYYDNVMSAEIARSSPGVVRLTMTAPEEINGVELLISGSQVSASYKGINIETVFSEPVSATFASVICAALDSVAGNGSADFSVDDGIITASGTTEYGRFILTAASDGSLTRLELPGKQLVVDFSQVQINE